MEQVEHEVALFEVHGGWNASLKRAAMALAKITEEECRTTERPSGKKFLAIPVSTRLGFAATLKANGYPALGKAATRLIGCHATSAAAERANSAFGSTYTAERSSLSRDTAHKLVQIRASEWREHHSSQAERIHLRVLSPEGDGFIQRSRNEEQRGADMARVAREARAAREAAQGQARAAREEEEAGPSRGRRPRGRPPANGARAWGNSGKGQKL